MRSSVHPMETVAPELAANRMAADREMLPRDVRARLVQESYARTAITVPIIAVAAIILGGEAWLRVGSPWLLFWVGVSVTISAARLMIVQAYRRSRKDALDFWATASDRLSWAAAIHT